MWLRTELAAIALVVALQAGGAPSTPTVIVVPVLDSTGKPMSAPAADGTRHPVLRAADGSPFVRRVAAMLASPAPQQALRLDRWARNLRLWEHARSGSAATDETRGLAEPAFLLLSEKEGGFARFGFWLQSAGGARRLVKTSYVDLVVDDDSLDSGDAEETFTHELGHAILRALVGVLPAGRSNRMHQSLAVTDYPTALDEGFAEHFQPLTREVTNNERLLRLERGTHDENLRSLWLSARDRRLRNDGVRANLFVHRKAPPAAAWDTDADRYRLWLASETSSAFDASELKNGQEMMASEGLIATLFYRIVSDERLRERRREPRFYDRFLGPSGAQPNAASPSPYENVALKLVAALSEVGRRGLDPGRPGMIDLVRAYGELFPDEREAITDVFVRTTCGATASRETADAIRALARSGSSGDIETFAGALPATRAQLEALVADVSAGRVALDAALGPELWLSNDSFKIAASPWSAERDRPLAFNLNTATEADLMSLPGLDARVARRIVAARDAKGTFTSLDDLAAIDGVGAALLGRLRERRTAP